MTRRSAPLLELLVVVLALLSILVIRAQVVESARVVRTSSLSNLNYFPPPLSSGRDCRCRLGGEELLGELLPPCKCSVASEMEMSVPDAGAAERTTEARGRTYSEVGSAHLRQLFGSMLPRGDTFPPAGVSAQTKAEQFRRIVGSMLPRGSASPPAGIPSPIHN